MVDFIFCLLNPSTGNMQMLDFGSSSEGSISESDNENLDSDYVPDDLDESGENDDDEELDDDELFEKEFRLHKRNYYITKMNYPEMTRYVRICIPDMREHHKQASL